MIEKQYQCQDFGPKEYEYLKEMLDATRPYEALEMKQALTPEVEGWWNGVLDNKKVLAVALITPQRIFMTGTDMAAVLHLGESMTRSLGKRSTGKIYSVFGPDDVVMSFLQGYKGCNCKQIGDIKLNIYELKSLAYKLNDAYTVRPAVKKDLPLVFDFYGEALIDELDMDIRKLAKDAHEANCAKLIESGDIFLGHHRGKPAFIAKITKSEIGYFLDQAFFPVAMRRPKVVRGIHARLAELLLKETSALVIQMNQADEELRAALDEVGYQVVSNARLIKLR